jgi:hypothetical protein
MPVPFESKPIKTAGTPREVAELMRGVISGGLPVYVIRRPKVSFDTVWNGFKRQAMQEGLVLYRRFHEITVERVLDKEPGRLRSDLSIHLDLAPCLHTPGAHWLQGHQVLSGACKVLFFEITRQHAEAAIRGRYCQSGHLPPETAELSSAGLVDPLVMSPEAYHHEAEPGDVLVFRAMGESPVAHQFVTTEYPRTSRIIPYGPKGVDPF